MALFKKDTKNKEAVKEPKKEVKEEKKEIKTKKTKVHVFNILRSPHVTEKASNLTEKNQYVFKVFSKANKIEIKKAVEDLYNVQVISVKIINIHKKEKRVGKTVGFTKGYKKAIVGLKQGQKIEILPR